jgi:predicted PurR-regulated permease PerM
VGRIPLIGPRLARQWRELAATGREELTAQAAPYVRTGVLWVAGRAGDFGALLAHLLLTVLITAILYTNGEAAARGVRRFARRLAGDRGDDCVVLAGQAIRAVALGVVVTALVQAAAGIGLAIVRFPYAAVLTAIILILCIAQMDPILVLAPAVVWLYWSGDAGRTTVLLVGRLPVCVLDNILRPLLIKRGADLPLLFIFAGVIGGLVSFGIIELFVGPVILGVTYRLLEARIADIDRPPDEGLGPAPAAAAEDHDRDASGHITPEAILASEKGHLAERLAARVGGRRLAPAPRFAHPGGAIPSHAA